MKLTEGQKEELLNSPLFLNKTLTLHKRGDETWYDNVEELPKAPKLMVLSGCRVIKTTNWYFMTSSHPYYTGYTGNAGVSCVLFVCQIPFELEFTSQGNAACHAYGRVVFPNRLL